MKKIVLLCIVLMAVNGFAGDLSHTTANLKTLLDTIDPNADGSPADGSTTEVSDAAVGDAGDADTTHAYSKDDIRDYVYIGDPDFDGKPSVLDASITIGATGTISEETNTLTLDDGDGDPITLATIRAAAAGGDDMGAVDTLAELNSAIADATILDDGAIADSTAIGLTTGDNYSNYGAVGDDSLNEMFAAIDTDWPTAAGFSVDDLITLSGVAEGDTELGEFTGTTITDDQTIKAALQLLETAFEALEDSQPLVEVATAFTFNDATPSVTGHYVFKTANAATPTTITQFDDMSAGQSFVVVIQDTSTTVDFSQANLIGNAETSRLFISGDVLSCYTVDGTVASCTISSASRDFTNLLVGTQFKLPSSNADPSAAAGYLRHDSTISNFTNGGLVFYDGAAIKQVISMTTATAQAATDDQVVAYDADADVWYCKDDSGSFAVADITGQTDDTTPAATATAVLAQSGSLIESTVQQIVDAALVSPAAIGTGTPAAGTFSQLTVSPASAPSYVANDSDDEAGTFDITGQSSGGDNAVIMTLAVEESGGSNADYIEVDGVSGTVDLLKPVVTSDNITISDGVVFIKEQADADADVAGYGQLWVNTATPNELYFTDDAGTDHQLGIAGSDDQTLAEVLASGADANDLDITSVDKLEGIDDAVYIDMGTDGVVEIEADTAIQLNGPVTMSQGDNILLTDNNTVRFDATADGMDDGEYNGTVITGMAHGETVGPLKCVFLASDAKFDIADADAAGEFPAFGLTVNGGDDTDAAIILTHGVVRDEDWTGLTVGGAVYLGDDGTGQITQTAPSTSGDCVQIVGWALSDSEIYFDFSRPYQEVE